MQRSSRLWIPLALAVALACSGAAAAQTCSTAADLDPAARQSVEAAVQQFFRMTSAADYASLRASAIPSLASSFGSVEGAIAENREGLQGAQSATRSLYVLSAEGNAPIARAEFFCGVFGANGHTANSAGFLIPNLSPGNYAIAILDARGGKMPLTVTEVLQQQGASWKLGGLYIRPQQIGGHDGIWYFRQARNYKQQGQAHNAWLYYLTAWTLLAPVDFMSTAQLDQLSGELQQARPADLPTRAAPMDLLAAGKTYRVTDISAAPVGDGLDVVARFQVPSVADRGQAFADTMAVIKAIVAKYPEFRAAFSGVVARAVPPAGEDYGSMLAMKDVK